ncbi:MULTISPECIES: hypothetical protein [Streptomyces]|uniref:Uncharacterized protein n=1 Tax=Streptomyces spororaveus TaxID=284039 RepID=A0ABQ3T4I7_9ACTN|nr:hypothetical protein [Streptomyces spororaveus]GHI75279.1 hypothetical protein Sspor_08400 [Streptomyces spororaveus]
MHSAPPEPELPDRVPEKRGALTPDLPPAGPSAPDLPDAAAGRPRRGSHEKGTREEGEQPAAGPGNAKPQEPTD